jgi:hypothetical protein
MNHLNYFVPYENRSPNHEDQLTRAFLVVLRLVPLVQVAFLDLIREEQLSKGITRAIPPLSAMRNIVEIETQVGTISQSTGTLVSILMTNERWVASEPVRVSERRARYDGVLSFEPDWIISIENKPWSVNVWEGQLSPNLSPKSEVEVSPVPIALTWDLVIARLGDIRSQGMLGWAEEGLLDDFLEFLDDNFKYLNPYKSFGVCKSDKYLLSKRCSAILHELAPGAVRYHRGFSDYISISSGPARQVYLYPDKESILLGFWPGDTVTQSREYFGATDRDAFLNLAKKGWTIEPNLHFSYRASNLVWAETRLSVQDYFDFWNHHKEKIRQFKRDDPEFQCLFRELRDQGLISDEDIPKLVKQFLESKRDHLNVCPGFKVMFEWLLTEAEQTDVAGKFVSLVKSKMQDVLSTWGQTLDELGHS